MELEADVDTCCYETVEPGLHSPHPDAIEINAGFSTNGKPLYFSVPATEAQVLKEINDFVATFDLQPVPNTLMKLFSDFRLSSAKSMTLDHILTFHTRSGDMSRDGDYIVGFWVDKPVTVTCTIGGIDIWTRECTPGRFYWFFEEGEALPFYGVMYHEVKFKADGKSSWQADFPMNYLYANVLSPTFKEGHFCKTVYLKNGDKICNGMYGTKPATTKPSFPLLPIYDGQNE